MNSICRRSLLSKTTRSAGLIRTMLAPVFAGLLLLCLQWQYLFICPLPTDGNETAKIGGMEVLTGQHRSPYYIQKSKHLQHDKLAYRKIDDTDNPLRPFVIATRK